MRASRALLAAGSLLFSASAYAQPVCGSAESIESTVANADLVVVGTIVSLDEHAQALEPSGREAVIAVEETLKRDPFQEEPDQKLRVRLPCSGALLEKWRNGSSRLLIAVDRDVPGSTQVVDLEPEELEVLASDFTLLDDADDVIRLAKETVRHMPPAVRRIHKFGLAVPYDAVAATRWRKYYETGGYLLLSVPVDERLEERALDFIRSSDYQRREEGVRALRYFKSDANIARVKKLLNDPGWSYLSRADENQGVEVRIYGIRQEAYRTLMHWGVDVAKPPIREERRKSQHPDSPP